MGACVLARTLSLPFCMHSFVLGRLSDVHRFRRQALLVHHSLQTTCCASSAGPLFTESSLFKPLGRSSQASMALSSSVEPPSQHKSSFVKVNSPKINFCSSCGGTTEECIPDGEERPRAVCTVCGVVHYQNPKMVVGCLVTYEDKILLCKRKIEPCSGLWTLPAGFMELGESAVEGAVRETWEEANAEVDVEAPFAQLDIPVIGQYMEDLRKGNSRCIMVLLKNGQDHQHFRVTQSEITSIIETARTAMFC